MKERKKYVKRKKRQGRNNISKRKNREICLTLSKALVMMMRKASKKIYIYKFCVLMVTR
jgi:hypothetical protein